MSGDGEDSTTGRKRRMPKVLKDLGAQALKRHDKRQATPEIEVASNDGGWTFKSPYRKADLNEWEALLFEAFATRSIAAFHSFTSELAALSPTVWRGEGQGWMPNELDLRAAIQIVRSVRPRSEAEACLAAQMVAVHRMQMKLSAQALSQSWPEPRTCAIAGKLARTFAMQLETMAKLKGKGSRQRITVRKYSQHEHKHIHLHQGGSENGNQPHEPRREEPNQNGSLVELAKGTPLPCTDSARYSLPVPGNEGAEAVPVAWRHKRDWSS